MDENKKDTLKIVQDAVFVAMMCCMMVALVVSAFIGMKQIYKTSSIICVTGDDGLECDVVMH